MKREELESKVNQKELVIERLKKERDTSKYVLKQEKNSLKKLKKQLEELPKLEVGKWYNYDNCLFNYQELSYVYGFINGKWITIPWSWRQNDNRPTPATDKEVQTALIEEAKKFVCKTVINLHDGKSCFIDESMDVNVYNDPKGFKVWFQKEGVGVEVFSISKWATIIEQKKVSISGDFTKEDLEKIIQTEFK